MTEETKEDQGPEPVENGDYGKMKRELDQYSPAEYFRRKAANLLKKKKKSRAEVLQSIRAKKLKRAQREVKRRRKSNPRSVKRGRV